MAFVSKRDEIPKRKEGEKMTVRIESGEREIVARLSGEIDHHHAGEIRSEIDEAVASAQPAVLVLDFREVIFMDSSGIGLIMGRYKAVAAYGGELVIANISLGLKKVIRLAGLDKLARIEENRK